MLGGWVAAAKEALRHHSLTVEGVVTAMERDVPREEKEKEE